MTTDSLVGQSNTVGAEDRELSRRRTIEFSDLVRSETGYVKLSLLRLGVDTQDLDDVAQETFVAVYRRLVDYDPCRPLRPWLFGIAFRVSCHYWRDRKRLAAQEQAAELPPLDAAGAPDELVEQERARRLVLLALESLDADKRAVFIMHDIDDMPMAHIAQALSIPPNTGYSRLRFARAQFSAAVTRLQVSGRNR